MTRTILAFVGGILVGASLLWALTMPRAAADGSVPRAAAAAPNPLLGKWKGPYSTCGMTFTPTTWSDFCADNGSESRRVAGYEIEGDTITVSFPSSDELSVYHMVDANTVTYDMMGDKATLHRIKQ